MADLMICAVFKFRNMFWTTNAYVVISAVKCFWHKWLVNIYRNV